MRQSVASHYYFQLRGSNNEILLTSERYTERENALSGVSMVRDNAHLDEYYERLISPRQEPYFALRATNNQILATSQMYSSEATRDDGIEAVKHEAPDAYLVWEIQ